MSFETGFDAEATLDEITDGGILFSLWSRLADAAIRIYIYVYIYTCATFARPDTAGDEEMISTIHF